LVFTDDLPESRVQRTINYARCTIRYKAKLLLKRIPDILTIIEMNYVYNSAAKIKVCASSLEK